jgi:DNA-3-methyladenine glycosylase II
MKQQENNDIKENATMSPLSTIEGTLTPRAPFDFVKTLQFVGDFTPTEGEQTITTEAITKAVTLNGRAVAFQVRSRGSVEEPCLAYRLFSERPLSDAEHETMRDRISFFLSLDDDLQSFYAIGGTDPHFEPVIKALYGLHQPKFLTPFEIACWAVLTQRIPIAIAHRTKMELMKRWGTSITLPEGTYYAFPEPQQMTMVSLDELATMVRNGRKAEYLQAVIHFFNKVEEDYLRTGDYDEVATRIRSIRGIGEWSAFFIMIRGLGRIERTSVSGKEIIKAASYIYRQEMTLADIQHIVDGYGEHQGYWAFYVRAGVFLGYNTSVPVSRPTS